LCGVLSLCMGFAAVLGIPLGVLALVLSTRDLRQIRAGRMDSSGSVPTGEAGGLAVVAMVLSLTGGALLCGGTTGGPGTI
jgi:hypothetical protein